MPTHIKLDTFVPYLPCQSSVFQPKENSTFPVAELTIVSTPKALLLSPSLFNLKLLMYLKV